MLAEMSGLTFDSPAKVNLTLRVIRRRDDGYHEIVSIVVRIGLADTVWVGTRSDGRIVVACDDPAIPANDRNLAHRAAVALRGDCGEDASGPRLGADIRLTKRIPAGAGLGGGSSNAATVLSALNRLWNVNLPAERLAAVGAGIGSDVPLFLGPPVCLVTGRGEMVTPLPAGPAGWVVLILPDIHLSTPAVYAAWRPDRADAGISEDGPSLGRRLADQWAGFASLKEVSAACRNDLTAAARCTSPEFDAFLSRMQRVADAPVHMTGSGSGLFALFDERDRAEAMVRKLRDGGAPSVQTVPLLARAV